MNDFEKYTRKGIKLQGMNKFWPCSYEILKHSKLNNIVKEYKYIWVKTERKGNNKLRIRSSVGKKKGDGIQEGMKN